MLGKHHMMFFRAHSSIGYPPSLELRRGKPVFGTLKRISIRESDFR